MSLIESHKTSSEEAPLAEQVRTPFRIRAHHLGYIYKIWSGEFPEVLAQRISTTVFTARREGYIDDVLGKTHEELKATENRMANFLRRYERLPADHPIEIVQTADGLCKSCHIGNHCSEQYSDYEGIHINAVINAAKFHNTHSPELPLPEIKPSGPLTILETTKSVLDEVFKECDFSDLSMDLLQKQMQSPQPA